MVALWTNTASGHGRLWSWSGVSTGPCVNAVRAILILSAVAQLAWVLLWPSAYSLRRRTACMVVQRALRVVLVAAWAGNDSLKATMGEAVEARTQGMSPVGAALRLCLGFGLPLLIHSTGVWGARAAVPCRTAVL